MPACQICLSNGVDGEAVHGSAFCAAQRAAGQITPAAVPQADITGLTQDTGNLEIGGPDSNSSIEVDEAGASPAPLPSGAVTAPSGLTVALPHALLAAFVDDDIQAHFPMMAGTRTAAMGAAELTYPASWASLNTILSKLGYGSQAEDSWQV